MESKQKFFQRVTNRLIVILLLTVAYPVIFAVFFPIFVFLILPITPFLASHPWLYIYWLAAAGVWLVLNAIILPQMRKEIEVEKILPREEESDIDLKKLSSRGSRDVLEETEQELSSRKTNDACKEVKEQKEASPEKEESRSRLSSVETEATVHQSDSHVKINVKEERSSYEKISGQRLDVIEEGRQEHQAALDDDYIPSLETNDVMDDEFSAETVIAKSTFSQRVQTFKISEKTYECSLPSPIVVSPDEKEKNTVFLFLNNEVEK